MVRVSAAARRCAVVGDDEWHRDVGPAVEADGALGDDVAREAQGHRHGVIAACKARKLADGTWVDQLCNHIDGHLTLEVFDVDGDRVEFVAGHVVRRERDRGVDAAAVGAARSACSVAADLIVWAVAVVIVVLFFFLPALG